MIAFLLLIILVNLLLITECANLWVDSSAGSSTQTGSEAEPCLSISKCMELAGNNDIVNVKKGIGYTGKLNSGVCSSPIGKRNNCTATGVTLQGYGNAEEILWYVSKSEFAERALSIQDNLITTLANMTITGWYYHPKFAKEVTDFRAAGGAVLVMNSTVHMHHMIFANNSAAAGGSVGVEGSNVTVSNSLFMNNQALVSGGAIVVDGGSFFSFQTDYVDNSATGNPATQSFGNGGALDIRGAEHDIFRFDGGKFSNNTAAQAGGAIHIQSGNFRSISLIVKNAHFIKNFASGSGSCVSSSACDVRGGAIFASVPSLNFINCDFTSNIASRLGANQLAEGGAVYATDVDALNQFGLESILKDCRFTDNSAAGYGGAAYVLNQYTLWSDCTFIGNSAGVRTELFADSSNAGGALWFSAIASTTTIERGTFRENFVWGGWGGAVFVTDSPSEFLVKSCNFSSNTAFSSYTFAAQGGGIMVSHNTIINIVDTQFFNNSAMPRVDIGNGPLTLSGSGGAIYGQSANLTITHSLFRGNLALTGQFDSGANGGALLLEDSIYSVVSYSEFFDNGAAGYVGFSTFASSGSAGGIMLKFSSATIEHCFFRGNWVSVGGTRLSSGGALAIYFDYTANGLATGPGVIIRNTDFERNTAFSSICATTGSKAGSGGAISVIGSNQPGVRMENVRFVKNAAVSRSGLLVLSYGGGMSVSVGSNVTGSALRFFNNFAINGLGNDFSVLGGDSSSSNNVVNLSDSYFNTTLTLRDIMSIKKSLELESARLCSLLTDMFAGDGVKTKLGVETLHMSKASVVHALNMHNLDRSAKKQPRTKAHHRNNNAIFSQGRVRRDLLGVLDLHDSEIQQQEQQQQQQQEQEQDGYSEDIEDGDEEEEGAVAIDDDNEGIAFGGRVRRALSGRSAAPSLGAVPSSIPSFYHYPSMLVVTGQAILLNPVFSGEYHVFFGDFLELLLEDEVATRSGCDVLIYGDIKQDKLAITAFRATLSMYDDQREILTLDKLIMINSTLHVANNLQIVGNSSVVDSVVMKDDGIINPLLGGALPRLQFLGILYTGFDLLDFSALSALSPASLGRLLTFAPRFTVDKCTIEILNLFELNIPRVSSGSSPPVPAEPSHTQLQLIFLNQASVNISRDATMMLLCNVATYAGTNVSDTIIRNDGTIVLDGYKHTFENKYSPDEDATDDTGTANPTDSARFGNDPTNSLSSVFDINGNFEQTPNGRIFVSLNTSSQSLPVINMLSNYTFLGQLLVRFVSRPNIHFYDEPGSPSTWEVVSYKHRKQNPRGTVQLEAPSGLGFQKIVTSSVNVTGNTTTTTYVDSYQISAMSCRDSIPYSARTTSVDATNLYPCFLCLSNSSCSYCNNGGCMDSSGSCSGGSYGGVLYQGTCCPNNCNKPHGECVSTAGNTNFVCQCTAFYTGETCAELSNITIVVVTLAGALVVVIIILLYNWRTQRGKKFQVLEELRQGLLFDQEGGGQQHDNINEAYLQSLQQGLILKDVSVKFSEIDIESQIGEGSFGVVYKATFRGASVAVKRMRPVFAEITSKEIEDFNKEAYMMSRLRHPNIVLVMGISFVEPEVMKFPKSMQQRKGANNFEDDEDAEAFMKSPNKKKEQLQKTVCIVTEYLEQGSLADILYGPQRLPAEIWTYDLVLTCALQAARGMLYLHSHTPPICHRDLKSSNLVVDDHWVVKVTDFGMSRIIPGKVIDIETGVEKASSVSSVSAAAKTTDISPEQRERQQRILARERESAQMNYEGRESQSDYESGDSHGSLHAKSALSLAIPSISEVATPSPVNISRMPPASASASASVTDRKRQNSRNNPGKDRNGQEMTSNLGTTAWCAPELLTHTSKAQYSVKVDVYSFGMVLWELWEKKRPYEDLASRFDIMDAIRSGKRPPISDSCPAALKSLIQRCWQGDPTRRPMFQYIVRYLKDELARVKRSRERASSSTAGNSMGSYGGSGYFEDRMGRTQSSGNSPLSIGGRISAIMPWNRAAATRGSIDEEGVSVGEPNSPYDAYEPLGASGKGTGGAEEGARAAASGAAPTPAPAPAPAALNLPPGRSPLYQNPDINYLAASPAVGGGFGGGNFMQWQQQQQQRQGAAMSPSQGQQQQQQQQPKVSVSFGAEYGGASPTGDITHFPPSSPGGAVGSYGASSAGAGAGAARQPAWRDRYVMKMSGWQPSQPDSGLPPSSSHGSAGGGQSQHSAFLSKSLENNSFLQQNKIKEDEYGEEEEEEEAADASGAGARAEENGRFFGGLDGHDDDSSVSTGGDGAGKSKAGPQTGGRIPSNQEDI